ncbi:MAG TPA: TatD family hydrolase [Gaiellaceae bacterium]|nr:TatD family hydrolase [Gaiellaceae bacterium]
MIDTHAHLDAFEDAGDVLDRARRAGVNRVITVGTDVPSCRAALALCDVEPGVFAALGLHPHEAGAVGEREVDELRTLLAHQRAVAVGEAGLDYYRDLAPRERQAWAFRAQAALAAELGKPLVIHTRAADEDTVAVLRDLAREVPVILHCFSSVSLFEPALKHGWYVSFAGNVTYPKAGDLRWAAARVPAERLLAETDSPYLAPQPVRGRRNEPAHVVHTVAALAEVRGVEPEALALRIEENAARLLSLP